MLSEDIKGGICRVAALPQLQEFYNYSVLKVSVIFLLERESGRLANTLWIAVKTTLAYKGKSSLRHGTKACSTDFILKIEVVCAIRTESRKIWQNRVLYFYALVFNNLLITIGYCKCD